MNRLSPFKWFVLQNFPFIEADFDALTNYELMCKVVEYLNATITKTNELGNQVEILTNWFNNLDVQDEIDHKLDEMVDSGELQEIIADYLNSKAVFGFDTKQAMKTATNLIDGSYAKTYGNTNYKTGDGHFYKVREILNTDVVDDDNIVALADPDLIAEKIPEYYYNDAIQKINQTNERIDDGIVVLLGDSYGLRNATSWTSWGDKLAEMRGWTHGVDYFNFCTGNSGLTVEGNNYLLNLQSNESVITNKSKVKKFIIAGGYNDNYYFSGSMNDSDYDTALASLVSYITTNYPNAEIYMGMIGNSKSLAGTGIRGIMIEHALKGYSKIANYTNGHYMNNVECIMHRYDYFISDNTHPNEAGAKMLAKGINDSVFGGGFVPIMNRASVTFSGVTMNIAQVGSNLDISVTGSCYPTIPATTGEKSFESTYAISGDDIYLRSVIDQFSRIPGVANAACSDGSNTIIPVQIKFKSDDGTVIFVLEIPPSMNGKSIGRLDFKYKPISLPIIYF